jgi:hypothetical protein
MERISRDLLVSILLELSDHLLLIRCSYVCKSWKFVVRDKGLWSSAALRKISQCLDIFDPTKLNGSITPSEDFLHDLIPELLGMRSSESMHWNQMACLFSSPEKFRMLLPASFGPSEMEIWLETRALALLNAAAIAVSEPKFPFDSSVIFPLLPYCAIARRTFLTEVLQPLHLHFWDGTDSNTFSHHVVARALTIYQLGGDSAAEAGGAARRVPVLKCLAFEVDAHIQYCHADSESVGSTWSLRALRRNATTTAPQSGRPTPPRTEWAVIASREASLHSFPPGSDEDEDEEDSDGPEQGWAVRADSGLAAAPLSAAAVAALVHPLVARCCRCLCNDCDEPPLPPPGPAAAAASSIRARIAAGAGAGDAAAAAAAPRLLASPADARAAAALRRALADQAGSACALAGRLAFFDSDESDGILVTLPPAGDGEGDAGRLRRSCFAVSERVGGGGRVVVLRFFAQAARSQDLHCLCARLCAAVFPADCGTSPEPPSPAAAEAAGAGGGEGVTVLTLWDGEGNGEEEDHIAVRVEASAVAAVAPVLLGGEGEGGGARAEGGEGGANGGRVGEAMRVLLGLVRCPGLRLRGGRGGGAGALSFHWELGDEEASAPAQPRSLAPLILE